MSNINDLFDCFEDNTGFDNENETKNPIVIKDEEENVEKYVKFWLRFASIALQKRAKN